MCLVRLQLSNYGTTDTGALLPHSFTPDGVRRLVGVTRVATAGLVL